MEDAQAALAQACGTVNHLPIFFFFFCLYNRVHTERDKTSSAITRSFCLYQPTLSILLRPGVTVKEDLLGSLAEFHLHHMVRTAQEMCCFYRFLLSYVTNHTKFDTNLFDCTKDVQAHTHYVAVVSEMYCDICCDLMKQ